LMHANFTRAQCHGASFSKANAQFATFAHADCADADFTGADLKQAVVHGMLNQGAKWKQVSRKGLRETDKLLFEAESYRPPRTA